MATLAANPAGLELEDFVAAHLASRHRFVETGVTERDPVDVLELDVVWTDYDEGEPCRHPVEVKSGDWGIGDVFKFYGWSRYLQLGSGWYFCRKLPGRVEHDDLNRLCERLDIALLHAHELENVAELLDGKGLPEPIHPWLPELWRYSFWAQRKLQRTLGIAIDQQLCPHTAKHARNYQKLINDATFFEPDVRSRVAVLMDAHWEHPKLALAMAAEIEGKEWCPDTCPTTTTFKNALYYGQHLPVQACLYLEQRARLAILKAAVDYIIARDANALPEKTVKVFGMELDLGQAGLYEAFKSTVARIEGANGFRHYPMLWQTFLWTWGGFILSDRKESEYEELSKESGVPVAEVESALQLWDDLFPIPGGWFASPAGDQRHQLKLMPAALRGIGAYRRLCASKTDDYQNLGLSDNTPGRLGSDHNTAVRLLENEGVELLE